MRMSVFFGVYSKVFQRRIQKELEILKQNGILVSDETSLHTPHEFSCRLELTTPAGETAYATLRLPTDWPFAAPKVEFKGEMKDHVMKRSDELSKGRYAASITVKEWIDELMGPLEHPDWWDLS